MTKRQARAHSSITVNEIIYQQIIDNTNKKGNVLNTAQIAGIMALKHVYDYSNVPSFTINWY